MDERATGLILRTYPLTETSLIVHWLTEGLGRISTVAKGARRPKSPFRGKLDLFFLADFSFARSRRSELHTLREVGLRDTHPGLRRELDWLRQAAYCAALTEQTTETETPISAEFGLLTSLIQWLPTLPAQPLTIFAFEMKMLAEAGLQPGTEQTHLSAGARQILEKTVALDWAALSRIRLSPVQTREIQLFLQNFMAEHLGRIPAGRDVALGL
jgi:DNA repair protein RecO (recombination protein O)